MPPRPKLVPVVTPVTKIFPIPPYPLSQMHRDKIVLHVRAILAFLSSGTVTGSGKCKLWDKKVKTSILSAKTKLSLALSEEPSVSLNDFRSWNPGVVSFIVDLDFNEFFIKMFI